MAEVNFYDDIVQRLSDNGSAENTSGMEARQNKTLVKQLKSEWKQAEIYNNLMFRLVMSDPKMCKPLLERVLNKQIVDINLVDGEKSIETALKEHGIRLDLFIKDTDGNVYDVEVQVDSKKKDFLGLRSRYYFAQMDLDALSKGTEYSELRQSIVIFICMFDPFGLNYGKYTFEETCQENKELLLEDKATKIFINVYGDKKQMGPELAAVADYFATGNVSDEYTKLIHQRVSRYRDDARSEANFMTYKQMIMEERADARAEGRAEGRVEGRAEGREECSQEIAWNLYEAKLPLDMIAKTTKLTMEQVKAVIKKHNVLI